MAAPRCAPQANRPLLCVLQPTSWDFWGLSQSIPEWSICSELWPSGELGQELRLLGHTEDTHDAVPTVKEDASGIKKKKLRETIRFVT